MNCALVAAGVPLGHGHVVDREGWRVVVVDDRPHPLANRDGGVRRIAEVDQERLVGLVQQVAQDLDGDGLDRLPGLNVSVVGGTAT